MPFRLALRARPPESALGRLWTFHGGLHPPDEKALVCERPIEPLPVPARLAIPLGQHIGAPARPRVSVGERVLKGQLIGEPVGLVSAAVHASASGTVAAVGEHPVAHPSGLAAPCVVIETDGEDAWAPRLPPLAHLQDRAQVLERIRYSGVVGLGGASFPTAVKLGSEGRIHTLIVNGAECEPYIACDDRLMRERAGRILAGAAIVRDLLGGPQVLFGIEDNKPQAIAAMERALAEADGPAAGLVGHARVVSIPTKYPSGGERQLIRILTGLEVPTQSIPARIGLVCQNLGTLAAVADAVLDGRPLVSRVVTVSGRAVARPANLEVPIGTLAADLFAHCGGFREPPAKLVCGGPMMGFALSGTEVPVAKGTNCLLALTPAEAPDPGPALACIRCGRCAEVCPARLLPQQLYWHARAQDFDRAQDYDLFDCIECGCCSTVCPSRIPLVQYYRFAKNRIWAQEAERRKADRARARHQAHVARLERQEGERRERLHGLKEHLEQGSAWPAAAAAAPTGAAGWGPGSPAAAAGEDARRAAIAAARERAAAKKAALATAAGADATAGVAPGSRAPSAEGPQSGCAAEPASGPVPETARDATTVAPAGGTERERS